MKYRRLQRIWAVCLSAALTFGCTISAFYVSAANTYSITKTYLNTFENESGTAKKQDGKDPAKSIEDVYNSYSYLPSGSNEKGPFGDRTTYGKVDPSWKSCRVLPYFDGTNEYGNNSLGSIRLGYAGNQTDGAYARLAIWDSNSNNSLYSTSGTYPGQPGQVISTQRKRIYRISFDYNMSAANDYKGGIYYAELSNSNIKGPINKASTVKLASVADTKGKWKSSGYQYIKTSGNWNIIGLALIMDDNAKSSGSYIYIDNLTIEETSASPTEDVSNALVNVNFKDDDGTLLSTVKAMPGLTWSTEVPTRFGFEFAGWFDEEENEVRDNETLTPSGGATYTAKWLAAEKGFTIANEYLNNFDNETGENGLKSIDDIYSYYSYLQSCNSTSPYFERKQVEGTQVGPSMNTGNNYIGYPLYDGENTLGKDSVGAVKIGYIREQVDNRYARLLIWNSKITDDRFTTTGEYPGQPTQVIKTKADGLYRISFDYKAEIKAETKAGIYYAEGDPTNVKGLLNKSDTQKLMDVSDTNGEWVNSGWLYAIADQNDKNINLAFIFDENKMASNSFISFDNVIVQEVELKAGSAVSKISFMDGDNLITSFRGVNCFEKTPEVKDPEKYGYIFKGWDPEYKSGVEFPLNDVVHTAVWEIAPGAVPIKVKFEYNDGATPSKTIDTIANATALNFPSAPMRSGYFFAGWYDSDGNYYNKYSRMPEGDSTFTARWAKIPDTAYGVEQDFENVNSNAYINKNSFGKISALMTDNTQISNESSAGSGKYSLMIKNTIDAKTNSVNTPAVAVVDNDGNPVIVKKGARYRISFSTLALGVDGAEEGANYVAAAISSELAENVGTQNTQIADRKVAFFIELDYSSSTATFEANRDGFLYFIMFARQGSGCKDALVSVDNVKLEVVSNAVKTELWYKNNEDKDVKFDTIYGLPGESLDFLPSPEMFGYEFEGWYTDNTFTEKASVYPAQDTKYWAKFAKADYTDAKTLDGSFTYSFGDNGESEESANLFYQSRNNSRLKSDMERYEVEVVHGDAANAHTGDSYLKLNYFPQCYIIKPTNQYTKDTYFLVYNPNGKYNKTWLTPNTTYKLSFWYKPENDFDMSQLYVSFVDPNDISVPLKYTSSEIVIDVSKAKGKQWNKLEIILNTPDVVSCLRISPFAYSIIPKINATVFNACIDDISVEKLENYTVKFNMNGGDKLPDMKVASGETIGTLSEEPFKMGYVFAGWYSDAKLTKVFDIENTPITGNIEIFAKWNIENKNSDNENEDDIIDNNNSSNSNSNSNSNSGNDDSYDDDNSYVYDEDKKNDINYGSRLEIEEADAIKKNSSSGNNSGNEKSSVLPIVIYCLGGVILLSGATVLTVILFKRKKNKHMGGGAK